MNQVAAIASSATQDVSDAGMREWVNRLPQRTMLYFVAAFAISFACLLAVYVNVRLADTGAGAGIRALLYFKTVVEIWCSVYAAYFIFISVHCLLRGSSATDGTSCATAAKRDVLCEDLAIVYLCCNDLDETCLESLVRTRSSRQIKFFLHDDSTDGDEQKRVDDCAEMLGRKYDVAIEVLRRGSRTGGKPGALNFVLKQIDVRYKWMLICDNDSFARDPDWYLKAAPLLVDERLACLQFRNVGPGNNTSKGLLKSGLEQSIDVFDVFLAPSERFGWLPFLGHNALLRLSAVREVGAFTPGEFADDIDLSVRLNLAGYRITYCPQVAFQETHPGNYWAFRARSYKWAYGCTSIMRRWAGKVVTSSELRPEQKLFFFVFIGFYYTQILLLIYLFISYFLLPMLIVEYRFSPLLSLLGGSLVVFLIYLPTLAYFIAHRRLRDWPKLAAAVSMVYGSVDFVSAKAVLDCVRHKMRKWVPTNTVRSHQRIPRTAWVESTAGFALLAVPFVMLPHLLYLPCSYLFALKFLVVPMLYLLYGSCRETEVRP